MASATDNAIAVNVKRATAPRASHTIRTNGRSNRIVASGGPIAVDAASGSTGGRGTGAESADVREAGRWLTGGASYSDARGDGVATVMKGQYPRFLVTNLEHELSMTQYL